MAGIALALFAVAPAGEEQPASTQLRCDLVASPDGSSAATGSPESPLRSAQALVDALDPGETGCLRAGVYAGDDEVRITTPQITLASYPGERATLVGRLWIDQPGDGAIVTGLNLDGRSAADLPSPTINADDVVVRDNDITNGHTEICLLLGSARYGRARGTMVEGNEIHDCGELPATNKHHGIYVNSADDTVIRGNWIHDNADRGVQLYPDAQRTLVTGNVIDHNGEGVIFGGDEARASSDNIIEWNVITGSTLRNNVEASWGGPVGTGNVVHRNCISGGAYDEGDGGIGAQPGFAAADNVIAIPQSDDDDFMAALERCTQLLIESAGG